MPAGIDNSQDSRLPGAVNDSIKFALSGALATRKKNKSASSL